MKTKNKDIQLDDGRESNIATKLADAPNLEHQLTLPKIKINKIKCLKCGDIIVSKSVHDFKWCTCHSCAVDGGNIYLKRCGNLEDWKELSELEDI